MKVRALGIVGSLVVGAFVFACGGSERRSGFETSVNATEADGGASSGFGGEQAKTGSCGVNAVSADPNKDYDGDGYALKDDCNECNTSINRGAHDIPGNGIDEDCSGVADDEATSCDEGLELKADDAYDGAKAFGLCKRATEDNLGWGVIEANWVRPDGSKLSAMEGVGVLSKLGVNRPASGVSMLALSSGTARDPSDSGYEDVSGHDKSYESGTPSGYPKESPACPGVVTGEAHDGAALELKIRVPSNAKSFSFQQNFFTYEYSSFVCSTYNDFYVAMMDPPPAGLEDGNIAFDQDSNPISVNNSLLQVCEPGNHKGKEFTCPLGTDTLSGTGFEGHAATGWLTTTAPVEPGSIITLRFAIWDSGDGVLDSTVLLDDFKWLTDEAGDTTTKPTDPK